MRSQRNRPALLFLESVGLQFQSVRGEALLFRFPAEFAAGIRYRAVEHAAAAAPAPRRNKPLPAAMEFLTCGSPTNCATSNRFWSVVGRTSVRADFSPAILAADPPRSDLERQLCRIWSGMLGVEPVGIYDNFFDLGGHSLLAVQLLSRLKEELAIELSLDVVYGADFTVAELAKAIELREIEMAGADRYAALLAEVESLTDEEVRELLAAESGEAPY